MRSPQPNQGLLLLTLVVAYGAFYLCRANVDAAFPLLRTAFGFTKTQLGQVASVSMLAYAAGKFALGALGEVIGGRRLILLAMAGSVVSTLAFGGSRTLGAFILFAACNRLFQSGGWSAAVDVIARRFDRALHGRAMGVLSTSYEIGNVGALQLCALVMTFAPSWRWLFIVNPLLLATVAAVVWLVLPSSGGSEPSRYAADRRTHGAQAGIREQEGARGLDGAEPAPRPRSWSSLRFSLKALALQPAFWVTLVLSALLTFLRVSFLTWTATYLVDLSRDAGRVTISSSIAKSAIFPAAGVVAALSMGIITDRLGPGRRAPAIAASLAIAFVLVLALGHGGVRSTWVAALLIGAVGLFLLGPYSLLAGAIALDVSDVRGASTAAGIIDGAGYLSSVLAGAWLGRLADASGWSAVFDVVASAALVAALVASAWAFSTGRRHREAEAAGRR
jgi:sugar phosphate permease